MITSNDASDRLRSNMVTIINLAEGVWSRLVCSETTASSAASSPSPFRKPGTKTETGTVPLIGNALSAP